MSTLVRDPWSDARRAATQEVLDADVAALRRRLWLRRLAAIVIGCLAVGLGPLLAVRWTGSDSETGGQPLAGGSPWFGLGIVVLGFLLMLVASVRSAHAGAGSNAFVTPDAFLTRGGQAIIEQVRACRAPLARPARLSRTTPVSAACRSRW